MKGHFHSLKSDYVQFYGKISAFFRAKPIRMTLLRIIYKAAPLAAAFMYIAMLLYCFISGNYIKLLKCIVIPAAAFFLVTVMRKILNTERPYTRYKINPLIHKDKKGESFPSRHTLSAVLITMTGFYVWPPLGLILSVLSVLLGASRIIAGVHFPGDVLAAVLIGAAAGALLFI